MKTKQTILEDYVVPNWCKMPSGYHNDGIGGCWGISYGYIADEGEDYCKTCEYYTSSELEAARVAAGAAVGATAGATAKNAARVAAWTAATRAEIEWQSNHLKEMLSPPSSPAKEIKDGE